MCRDRQARISPLVHTIHTMPTTSPETEKFKSNAIEIVYSAQVRARNTSGVEYTPDQIRMLNEADAKDVAMLIQMLNQ